MSLERKVNIEVANRINQAFAKSEFPISVQDWETEQEDSEVTVYLHGNIHTSEESSLLLAIVECAFPGSQPHWFNGDGQATLTWSL